MSWSLFHIRLWVQRANCMAVWYLNVVYWRSKYTHENSSFAALAIALCRRDGKVHACPVWLCFPHCAHKNQFRAVCWSSKLKCIIMVALCNRGAIIFLPCSYFLSSVFFFFSSPNLSGHRLYVYHTSTHGGRRLYSAGRPSRWALIHILVIHLYSPLRMLFL